MESSPLSSYQFRSISLPSRLHPHSTRIDVELNKLKTWQSSLVSSSVPTSGETIRIGLVGLADLYSCVEELIHFPVTQQPLIQNRNGVLVEAALEESIRFLDSCSVARDLLLMMKENIQDLQSVLRRKGGTISIGKNINAYDSSKKKVKKGSAKWLRALKKMEKQNESCSLFDVNYKLSNLNRVLGEVKAVTISVVRLLFLFLSAPDSSTRPGMRWSLIKKLVVTRPTEHKIINEIGSVDVVLQSLRGCIQNNNSSIDVQMARRRFEALGDSMEGVEDGLNCLYRQLIRNRVSLLNILAH